MVQVFADDLLIKTSLGTIKGTYTDYCRAFFNIPFAPQPQRFEPSTVWTKPFQADPYDATFPGNCCLQPLNVYASTLPQSEDCLNLNVFLPKQKFSEKLPVMVWIHGGAFIFGSGGDALYTQSDFADNQNVVLVTINYRLGVFGQFAYEKGDGTTSGLVMLSDFVSALKWVNNNIESFGGDPDNISIFGESAGGISVCLLVASPFVKQLNLFKRASIMSGPCHGPWGPNNREEGLSASKTLMNSLQVDLNGLRNMSAASILKSPMYSTLRPSVDNMFITKADPIEHFKEGLALDSLIIGSTFADGTNWQGFMTRFFTKIEYLEYPQTWQEFETQIQRFFPVGFRSIVEMYQPLLPNATEAFFEVNSDICVRCPTQELVSVIRNNVTTFLYDYAFAPDVDAMAPHGSDTVLLFKTWQTDALIESVTKQYNLFDNKVANVWQKYFSDFSRMMKPASEWNPVPASGNVLPVWMFSQTAKLENADQFRCEKLSELLDPTKASEACSGIGAPPTQHGFRPHDFNDEK